METCRSSGLWGDYSSNKAASVYYLYPWSNSSALPTKVILQKVAQYKEMVDPVAGTINGHIINAAFTTDETLLCRAEAYIMKGSGFYQQAIADLNVWQSAFTRSTTPLTVEAIDTYYGEYAILYPSSADCEKKELHPCFHYCRQNTGKSHSLFAPCTTRNDFARRLTVAGYQAFWYCYIPSLYY